MMEALPIACSLSAADLADREAAWARLINGWAVSRGDIPGGIRIGFRPAPGLVDSLRQLAELEAECCPWMQVEINDDAGVEMIVTAEGDGEAVVRRMLWK